MRSLLNAEDKNKLLVYLDVRFGLKRDDLLEFDFIRTKRYIYLSPKGIFETIPENFRVEKIGMRSFSGKRAPFKPTSLFLQLHQKNITKNKITITREEWQSLLENKDVETGFETTKGYVFIECDGIALGCAFYEEGRLSSQFPKSLSHFVNP